MKSRAILLLLLLAGLLVAQAGCTLTKKDEPRSLHEWGKLSRPTL
jgi:hypothetical protein